MRILHVSDLHFGIIPQKRSPLRPATSAHFFERDDEPDPSVLVGVLRRDPLLNDPSMTDHDLIVVSGDLAWSGIDTDYEYAHRFLTMVRAHFPAPPIVMVPGNHDFDRSAASGGENPQAAFLTMAKRFYGEQFDRFFPLLGTSDLEAQRHRIVCMSHPHDEVLVVGVNSAAGSGDNGAPVFVDPEALSLIQEQIDEQHVSDRALKLFVIHHHLLPFAEPNWKPTQPSGTVPDRADPTIVANSAKLQGWLATNGFRLVLHGHKHISHARRDTLWRPSDEPGADRTVVFIGAGSAGVNADHRREPLSYNVIDATRLEVGSWAIEVNTRRISDAQVVVEPQRWSSFATETCATVDPPVVITADRMDDCHAAIQRLVKPSVQYRNFLSVVNDCKYRHPGTTRIGTKIPTIEEVKSSFQALHPEYNQAATWSHESQVNNVLDNLAPRFQFQHGPRLFGVYGRAGVRLRGLQDRKKFQPIWYAVDQLQSSSTRSYVGLYNAEVDVGALQEPLPGLVGIQFVPDGEFLDAVATFRKLELSFWWVVNMFEVGELLRWASTQDRHRRRPRRITFFAALAEWKAEPEATFVTELDGMNPSDLCELVVRVASGDNASRDRLAFLLEDKADKTNEVNLDDSGLVRLADLIAGLRAGHVSAPGTVGNQLPDRLIPDLREAAEKTGQAIVNAGMRDNLLRRVQQLLRTASSNLCRTP